jgi:predicted nucleotidyltransferase
MAQIPNEIIDAVKKFRKSIDNDLSVKKVFIFGSFAKGNFTENSDIDVCVIAEDVDNNFLAEFKIAPKVLKSDVRIEPVVFSEKEYLEVDSFGLLKEVKENGIEIL